MYRALLISIFLLALNTGFCQMAFAQSTDPIERIWYNDDRTAKIKIYKGEDGKFSGKVIWLKVPERDGQPKVDKRNPDPAKRNRPIVGLVVLKGFTKDGDNEYEDGTVYDPESGKTYSCKMTRDGKALEVRGYLGISMFGKSTTFYCD